MDTLPSDDAHASTNPYSCGAHEIELTDESWTLCSYTTAHECCGASRWINTLPSYEHDAKMTPNFGWAHDTCHTGPSWPVNVAVFTKRSPEASKTFIERSELHVANRFA